MSELVFLDTAGPYILAAVAIACLLSGDNWVIVGVACIWLMSLFTVMWPSEYGADIYLGGALLILSSICMVILIKEFLEERRKSALEIVLERWV